MAEVEQTENLATGAGEEELNTLRNVSPEQSESYALNRFLDHMLFCHTTLEGMNPPSREELEKLNRLGEQLLIPPPKPLRIGGYPHIEGVSLKHEDGSTDVLQARRRAMFLCSPIFGFGNAIDKINDMVKAGADAQKRLEMLSAKIDELSVRGESERIEALERERQKLLAVANAHRIVLEMKQRAFKKSEELKKKYRQVFLKQLAKFVSEDAKVLFSFLEPFDGESPELTRARAALAEKLERTVLTPLTALAKVHERTGAANYPELSSDELNALAESGVNVRRLVKLWREKYQAAADLLSRGALGLERGAVESLKRLAVIESGLREFEKDRTQVLAALEKLQLSEQESQRVQKVKDVLSRGIRYAENVVPSAEEIRALEDEVERAGDAVELDKLKNKAVYERLAELSEAGFSFFFSFRNDEELVSESSKLFNALVLLEKAREGKLSPAFFSQHEEMLAQFLPEEGGRELLQALPSVAETVGKEKSREHELAKPLSPSEYMQMLADVRAAETAQSLSESWLDRLAGSSGLLRQIAYGVQSFQLVFFKSYLLK